MTTLQYKKVLNIAEALLKKVDIPQETMQKYQELKLRLLGETDLLTSPLTPENPEKSNLREEHELLKNQSTIDLEIISIHQNFLGTVSNLFDCNLNRNSNGLNEDSPNFEDYLTPFFQSFEEKKIQIRDMILESALEPANRLILS